MRVRRRPHLPHGPAADGGAAPRVGCGGDGGGDPGAARALARLRGDRGRRDGAHPPLPREGRRPAADAGRPDPLPRIDGELRVRDADADRRRDAGRRGPAPNGRGRGRDPRADGGRRGTGVRLLHERHPRAGRARARVLARRRDARRVLRREHGPHRAGARVQSLQRRVARAHPSAAAPARQGVARRGRRGAVRRREPALPGVDHLRRAGRALDRRAGELRRRGRLRGRLDRLPRRPRRGASAARALRRRQEQRRPRGLPDRESTPRRTPRASRSARTGSRSSRRACSPSARRGEARAVGSSGAGARVAGAWAWVWIASSGW